MTEPIVTVEADTLFERFRTVPTQLSAQNGVLIAGTARVGHADGDIGLYTGASLSGAWPALAVNETAVTTSATARLVNAIVRFYAETGAPGATKGTQYGTALNKITHNGTTTVWTGSGYTVGLNVPLEVGDYVRIDDNGSTILHTRVVGFEAISGSMKVLVLADSIPAALRGVGVYFNVTVGQVAGINLTNAQLTATTSTVTIPASLTAATTRTGSAYAVIGATLPSLEVLGEAYVTYQASLAGTFTNAPVQVYTQADVDALFPDVGPDSGLGFAASRALSPVLGNTQPAPVTVISPATDDLVGYQALIDAVRFRSNFSTMAVLSEDQLVVDAFVELAHDRSANYQPTQLFVGQTFLADEQVGASAAVTIDDSQTPASQRTFTVVSGAPFASALPGDTIRHYTSPTVYSTYVIATVISAQAAVSTTAVPGGPLAGQTIQVWHHLTTSEQVLGTIATAQSYADESVNLVYPDNFSWGGVEVPPYMMAAQLAAIRSWSAPQQLLAFVTPEGWTAPDMSSVTGYEAQLASGGLFVFDVSTSGLLYVRYPRTTDPSTVDTANSVIVATKQFCIRYIASQLLPYLGLYRTSAELYAQLRTAAVSACTALQSASVDPIGSIIINYDIGTIARSTTNANTVVVPITLTVAGIAEDVLQLDVTVVLG